MSTLYERICRNLEATPPERWAFYQEDAKALCSVVQGWTSASTYGLFQSTLEELAPGSKVLVCGVYHGADIRLMIDIAKRLNKDIEFFGVDIFANVINDDWHPDQIAKGDTWEEALGLPGPSMRNALINCPEASILRSDSVGFMSKCDCIKFDWVYLDTAHNYEHVANEIRAAKNCVKPDGLMAGDDFLPGYQTNWGVDKAVRELLPEYTVVGGRAWFAPASQMFTS